MRTCAHVHKRMCIALKGQADYGTRKLCEYRILCPDVRTPEEQDIDYEGSPRKSNAGSAHVLQADLEARTSLLGLDQVQGQLQPLMKKAAEAFAKVAHLCFAFILSL